VCRWRGVSSGDESRRGRRQPVMTTATSRDDNESPADDKPRAAADSDPDHHQHQYNTLTLLRDQCRHAESVTVTRRL